MQNKSSYEQANCIVYINILCMSADINMSALLTYALKSPHAVL